MYLNFSLDKNNWKVYWFEIADPFLNIRVDEKEEIMTSIHLGFVDCRPSSAINDKPDVIEFFCQRRPCLLNSFYVYSYETFSVHDFFKKCLDIHLNWNKKIQTTSYQNQVVVVKPKTILSMKQKWKITQDFIDTEKGDSSKCSLEDIEILAPSLQFVAPLQFFYKSKASDERTEQKCLTIEAFQTLFDACFTNIAKLQLR